MTRYIGLLVAAYALVVVETSLQTETGLVTPYGSFVWMLLPWLATLPSPSHSIIAAAFYGLMIDAVSNHHPGLMIAATILSTCILQRVITPKSLETTLRVFVVSFACACLMAMLVATVSMLTTSSSVTLSTLAGSIVMSSIIAATFSTLTATLLRNCGNVITLNEA